MTIKNKIIYAFSIFLSVFLVSGYNCSNIYIKNCFKNSGAEFLKAEVEGHSYVDSKFSPDYILQKVFKSHKNPVLTNKKTDATGLQVYFNDNERKCTLCIKKSSENNNYYVSLSESQESKIENINNIYGTISSSFKGLGVSPCLSTLVEGKFNRRLSEMEMKNTALKCIDSCGGNYVEGLKEQNMISLCGYIPGIKERVKCTNKYININIAMRYSESCKCTYMWIASPIITIEY